jgi:uncharacterized protein (UPF0128 family)
MKTRAVGPELFHVDGQRYRHEGQRYRHDGQRYRHDEANSRLSQFCKHSRKMIFGMGHPVMIYERTDGESIMA